MNCYCGHPKSMHDSDGDERQEKFWCNGEDCDCGRFIPFRENRPTLLAPDACPVCHLMGATKGVEGCGNSSCPSRAGKA